MQRRQYAISFDLMPEEVHNCVNQQLLNGLKKNTFISTIIVHNKQQSKRVLTPHKTKGCVANTKWWEWIAIVLS